MSENGNPEKVKMGVCWAEFDDSNLGYTSGNVRVTYNTESVEKRVDQEDAALDEMLTNQTFEVVVPLAEQDLARMADLFPGATVKGSGENMKLDLSGSSEGSLIDDAKKLVLKPKGSESKAIDWLTVHHALPRPTMNFAYEKENVRVYEVTFKALVGENGWVTFGDETAT